MQPGQPLQPPHTPSAQQQPPLQPAVVPSTMPTPTPTHTTILSPANALEHFRLSQLYQYAMAAERLRCPPSGAAPTAAFFPSPFLFSPYCRFDAHAHARLALCRPPEEPKPQHSYIGLIAMAILSSPDKKLVLSDIYQYILDNYPYFRSRGPGWRNSIRHNLSLNDCFVKAGRSANGKGHYWAIHAANMEDFQKGDFRRRKAQRKVRRSMGLAVDDEDSPSPPPSASPPPPINWPDHMTAAGFHAPAPHFGSHLGLLPAAAAQNLNFPGHDFFAAGRLQHGVEVMGTPAGVMRIPTASALNLNRKRQFDVASLLAPEKYEREDSNEPAGIKMEKIPPRRENPSEEDEEADDEEESEQIDVDDNDIEKPAKSAGNSPPREAIPPGSVVSVSSDEEESLCQAHLNGRGGKIPTGSMTSMEFAHAQQAAAQAQASQYAPGFHLSPTHLLHNPSLASLMILSSRYRELTNNLNSGGNSNNGAPTHTHATTTTTPSGNNHKRHSN